MTDDFDRGVELFARLKANDPTLTVLNTEGLLQSVGLYQRLLHSLTGNTFLKELNLANNGLGWSIEAILLSLMHIPSLETLNISGNRINDADLIRSVMDKLKYIPNLKHLDISNNKIDRNTYRLSELIKSRPDLRTLNISECQIRDPLFDNLVQPLTDSNVASLYLSGNELTGRFLDYLIIHNTSIQHLNLGFNKLNADGIKLISQGLAANSTLKTLNLGGSSINMLTMRYLAQALVINTSLEELDLSHNSFSSETTKILADALAKNIGLRRLTSFSSNMGTEGLNYLNAALELNSTLEYLDVGANNIIEDGGFSLEPMLRNNTTLKELKISHNHLGDIGVELLFEGLSSNRSLEALDIGINELTPATIEKITDVLARNRTLKSFTMENEDLRNGRHSFYKVLSFNSSLLKLDLSESKLDEASIKDLSAAFLENESTLEELTLNWATADDHSMIFLFSAIAFNKTLKSLYVSKIKDMSDIVFSHLLSVIRNNSTLEIFDICRARYEVFTEPQLRMIATELEHNPSITKLNLQYIPSSSPSMKLISKYLERNLYNQERRSRHLFYNIFQRLAFDN